MEYTHQSGIFKSLYRGYIRKFCSATRIHNPSVHNGSTFSISLPPLRTPLRYMIVRLRKGKDVKH